jgi:aspartoacylase
MVKKEMVRRVAIVGGTHGNETNGVFVVDGLSRDQQTVQRPSLKVETLIGNPKAVDGLVRFIDEDLNRQFTTASLSVIPDHSSYEAERAMSLNHRLGPKGSDAAADFVIDLHTTTANMGCCIIVPCDDILSLQAAVYVQAWMLADPLYSGKPIKIFYIGLPKTEAPYVGSIGQHGLMIECGPSPWGLVRHDIVTMMRGAINHILDFLEGTNSGHTLPFPNGQKMPATATVNAAIIDPNTGVPAKIAAPADDNGRPLAMFHPQLQDSDWSDLRKGDPMFVHFDGSIDTYDGQHGDCIKAHFINEAAYYLKSSGLGFELSVEKELPLTSSMQGRARL